MATDYTYLYEEYPEVISADQLYRICHISKRKAKWLLEHGYIPCEDSGKKTRRYKIRLNDVIDYGWIEGIGDQRLVRVLKRLSISEKELLTKYCIEDKTQQEIAAEMGLSQRAVGKQLQQLKNFFRKF